jgi:hypothetical protein
LRSCDGTGSRVNGHLEETAEAVFLEGEKLHTTRVATNTYKSILIADT